MSMPMQQSDRDICEGIVSMLHPPRVIIVEGIAMPVMEVFSDYASYPKIWLKIGVGEDARQMCLELKNEDGPMTSKINHDTRSDTK